ncbi:MAG: lantibiotic dehydratase, partial [Flavobacteriaceae bacterium]|nr:lantibiotic dehydratase [Flavobacteriaceae bacterium]
MKYKFLDSIVLRTPALPMCDSFDDASIKKIVDQDFFKEALYLSSPTLHSELDRVDKDNLITENAIFFSVLKYIIRMQSRATPFGLLAQCSVADWCNLNNIVLGRPKDVERQTRLDTQFLEALKKQMESSNELKNNLLFYPNNSSYQQGDKIRYVEFYYQNIVRKYSISSVNYSEFLNGVLQKAVKGEKLSNLVLLLCESGIEEKTAQNFIDSLVAAKILVSELEPNLTGKGQAFQLLETLNKFDKDSISDVSHSIISTLAEIELTLSQLDDNIINPVAKYSSIIALIKKLNAPFDINRLFQVDSSKKLSAKELNIAYKKILKKTVKFLLQLPNKNRTTNLESFKTRFYHRYEECEVPLLEVLDTETGIGYLENQQNSGDTNVLTDDIVLPRLTIQNKIEWDIWEDFLHKEVELCISEGKFCLTLNNKKCSDLFDLSFDRELPDTFGLMFSVINEAQIMLHPLEGSSAGNMIGRFGLANTEISNILSVIAKEEQSLNSNAIIAEIVHLPQDRIGNIISRPQVRDYEIPYLGKSTLPKGNQIPLSDLVISIKNNRIFLRSIRLNCEVIPRMTTAHNFSVHSLPVYHFLCDMQVQNKLSGVYFSWGQVENMYSFLPRVEYGNVILSPATWQLKKDIFKYLLKVQDANLLEEINLFRKKHTMPQHIAIADGDNELMINLKDFWSVKMMLDTIKNREAVKLIEFLFDPDTAIVRDVEGNPYTNQFIAFLIKEKLEEQKPVPMETKDYKITNTKVQRSFSLGTEWLYYKIYCGYKTADRVLAEIIKPLTEQLLEQKLITQWFFIRYADPDPHIRVRFKLADVRQLGLVIEKFSKQIAQFEAWGLVW